MKNTLICILGVLLATGCGPSPEPAPAVDYGLSARDAQRLENNVVTGVRELADSAWPEIRRLSLEVLSHARDIPLAIAAEKLLTDTDDEVRVQAARTLADSGRREANRILEDTFLSDSPPSVRYAAAEALHKLGELGEKAHSTIIDDAFSRRAETATAALIFLCKHSEVPLSLRRDILEAGSSTLQMLASVALINRNIYSGFEVLREAVTAENSAERRTLAWVLQYAQAGRRWTEQTLKVLLADPVLDVRLTAATAAMKEAIPGLASYLARLLKHARSDAESMAYSKALSRIETEEAASHLVAASLNGDAFACMALAEAAEMRSGEIFRSKACEQAAAFQLLGQSGNDLLRAGALRVLATCSDCKVLGELEDLAFHSLDSVAREAALEGLAVNGDRFTVDRLNAFFVAKKDLPGKAVARERLLAAKALLMISKRLSVPEPDATPLP